MPSRAAQMRAGAMLQAKAHSRIALDSLVLITKARSTTGRSDSPKPLFEDLEHHLYRCISSQIVQRSYIDLHTSSPNDLAAGSCCLVINPPGFDLCERLALLIAWQSSLCPETGVMASIHLKSCRPHRCYQHPPLNLVPIRAAAQRRRLPLRPLRPLGPRRRQDLDW